MNTIEHDLIQALTTALAEAQEHLEFCGYGDRYERECAEETGLAKVIEHALVAGQDWLNRRASHE